MASSWMPTSRSMSSRTSPMRASSPTRTCRPTTRCRRSTTTATTSRAGATTPPWRPSRAPGRSLARLDPLQLYIQDIRRYPLLSREDEHELAEKFVETGDVDAARRLVTANLRLVVKIAHEYRRAHRNLLDLIQEGNVGLVQAVKKYDPVPRREAVVVRGVVDPRLHAQVHLEQLAPGEDRDHAGAAQAVLQPASKEKDKLERWASTPSSKALAEALDVPEREVIDMEKRLGQGELSLDAPLGKDDDGGRSHLDMLESAGDMRPDVRAEGDEFRVLLREKLETFAETLRGRELTIFQERLLTDEPKTLQEIGESYGISARARAPAREAADRQAARSTCRPSSATRCRSRWGSKNERRRARTAATPAPTAAAGTLYVVSTPIGNLEDMTLRAIARAEGGAGDRRRGHARGAEPACATSRSRGRRCVSFFEGNEAARTEHLMARLRGGDDVARDLGGGHAGRVRSGRAAGRGGGGGGRARGADSRARRRRWRRWWRRGCRRTSSTSSAFPRATAGRGCRRSRGCATSRPTLVFYEAPGRVGGDAARPGGGVRRRAARGAWRAS